MCYIYYMNKLLLSTLLFTVFFNSGKAQTAPQDKTAPALTIEQQAEYPGGLTAMASYLRRSIVYPDSARKAGIIGRCLVKFIIRPDGSIDSALIIKGVPGCPGCDSSAVQAVRAMPRWTPARMNGKPVSCYYNLPINFKP
jgi:protein TonB